MEILSLELKGYKRLRLNKIDYIKITPHSKIQLILGTNGSGKSSLIKEMSPLPGVPAEFEKDGFKVIELLHNNSRYTLKSTFGSSNRFNFIKDGEELNPGGTASVFKDIVKREFGITAEIHNLMTGSIQFHSMSVSERRAWMNRLSDADYTFAGQYYSKLKEYHRDLTGAIKMNQSRLMQESGKLLNPEEAEVAAREIKELQKLLDQLFELKTPAGFSQDSLSGKIEGVDEQIANIIESMMYFRRNFLNEEGFDSIESIEEKVIEVQSTIRAQETIATTICEEIDKHQQSLVAIRNTGLSAITDIDGEIDALHAEIGRLSSQKLLEIVFKAPNEALGAINAISGRLTEIFSQMPVNASKAINRASYENAQKELQTCGANINAAKKTYQEKVAKRAELIHLRDHSEATCPKCEHRWFQNFDPQAFERLNKEIDFIDSQVQTLEEVQPKLENRVQSEFEYLSLYRSYAETVRAWPVLKPFWDQLEEWNYVFDNPGRVLNSIQLVVQEINIQIEVEQKQKRLTDAIAMKELQIKNQGLGVQEIETIVEALNQRLVRINSTVQTAKQDLSKYQFYRKAVTEITDMSALLEKLIVDRESFAKELTEAAQRDSLLDLIRETQNEIAKREQSISKISVQKALIESLTKEVESLTERGELVKIAMKELSPSEGIIAKGMTAFINSFMMKINNFISKIWLYPLELVLIEPEGDESLDLDYKFSVQINDSFPIPDIMLASAAMKEVIDLAFMVVSLHYLHLNDHPLFLDEFARTMDHAHRQSAFYAITNLMASDNFSQIFMISHYENSYGSLKNADVTVLCPSNISLPKDMAFNQHVIIG